MVISPQPQRGVMWSPTWGPNTTVGQSQSHIAPRWGWGPFPRGAVTINIPPLAGLAPSREVFGREIAGVIDFEPEARAVGRMQDHSLGVIVDFQIAIGGDGDNGAAKGSRAVDFERG